MGRIVLRGLAALLLLCGLAWGGLATFVYLMVGTENEIPAQGFTISAEEFAGCPSFVLDVQSIDLDPASGDFLLGDRETYLEIATSPESTLQAVKVETTALNDVLLGRTACVISITDSSAVDIISSGDTVLSVTDFPSAEFVVGERILFPLSDLAGSSIFTSFDPSPANESDVTVSGLVKYPQSTAILWTTITAAVVFLSTALVLMILTRKKRIRIDGVEGASPEYGT